LNATRSTSTKLWTRAAAGLEVLTGKDWNVVRFARDGDFVLVTNNASDFRQLYAAQPLHAGLVIVIPVVGRHVQRRLFEPAHDELAIIGGPINRALEVDLDGDEVTLTLYDWPPAWS
jgi:hypothetical protein